MKKLRLKIDLHVHSTFSPDSTIKPKQLVYYARKNGMDGVAIADHDRLDSSQAIRSQTDFLLIPAMEITSLDGHIVGLNVRKAVAKGLPADETVEEIHQAGGIAIACHPAALFKKSLGGLTSSSFDAIEVINSSAIPFGHSIRRSEQIASHLGIPRVAGSDAHYGPEIGSAYTQVNSELEVEGVVNAIKNGMCTPFGNAIPLGMRLKREIAVLLRKCGFDPNNKET